MGDDLKAKISSLAKGMGIPMIGFAPVSRWEDPPFHPWMPAEFYPQNVIPGTRTVIVIGLPVSLPILETTPSVNYHELYKTITLKAIAEDVMSPLRPAWPDLTPAPAGISR